MENTGEAVRGRIVVVDDDEGVLALVPRLLTGFDVQTFSNARGALAWLRQHDGDVDAVLSDLHMPELDGLGLLAEVHAHWPDVPFVVMTGDGAIAPAVEAMRRGAYDYVSKPLSPGSGLDLVLVRAVEKHQLLGRAETLEKRLALESRFESIVGKTAAMRAVFQLIDTVASTDATVLILGESGTGKELVARALHVRSRRAQKAFLAINCSALTESLLESELFGHVKGAFSGATNNRRGLFEQASGGTLLLDEIGDVSPAVQVRLLRALQEGEIKPVGSDEVRNVDVRVIAATNRDLAADVKEGDFREDLFYRLNVVGIDLPALRDRGGDVPILIAHFLQKYSERLHKPAPHVEDSAMLAMQRYEWPGNVRELENAVHGAMVLSQGGDITLELLPRAVRANPLAGQPAAVERPFSEARAAAVAKFEKAYLDTLLEEENGNITRAARRAGIDKSNLRKLARRYGIDVDRIRKRDAGV